MKSSTETSILSVLFGGIVESAFEENVLHNNAFSLSRCNRVFLGFEESIDRSKIMCVCVCACVRGDVRDEFRVKREVSFQKMSRRRVFLAFVYA